ncbi:hypothetical protein [Pseudaminobacter soli (ex Li et al. 2025)]|uniref:hypothetical protein n=1 Tax=Pseudaminobacter soli (ex Li et al. 2025) TaxID=1295366 RepID=UPI0015E7D94D|nr:hypothetical protein [Mesorhizobium soli]
MKRYLSTLACSGLLSIGALYGGAFAASFPGSIPDVVPTANVAGEAFRTLPAQPVDSGIHELSCSTAMHCDQGGLRTGVLLPKQDDDPGGLQLVRGGGGGGGGHGGGGGMGGGGMGGGGVGAGGVGGGGVGSSGVGGGGFFGFGLYPHRHCNPRYGPCYPENRPRY